MPFFLTLWFQVAMLPSGASTLPYHHIHNVITEVTQIALTEDPIDFADTDDVHEERLRTAQLALTWGWCEGAWKADPGGDACGVGQMYPVKGEPSCASMRSDRRIGFRAMMRRMRSDVAYCGGDLMAGLGKYASGKCGWARSLVTSRCAWSFGACADL